MSSTTNHRSSIKSINELQSCPNDLKALFCHSHYLCWLFNCLQVCNISFCVCKCTLALFFSSCMVELNNIFYIYYYLFSSLSRPVNLYFRRFVLQSVDVLIANSIDYVMNCSFDSYNRPVT